jgi:hypothetical protein
MNKCQITVFEKNGGPLTKRIALRGGMIDPDTAVAWLHDCGVLDHVMPAPPHGGAP